jgi:DNA replication and repair protein RecF
MFLSSITTSGFRNLNDAKTDTQGKDIFLIGLNGQGKSNFLEAVYFCSYASSFRRVKDFELICNGKKECFVRGDAFDKYLSVRIRDGKKIINTDGKSVTDRKELLSFISSIVFCHEDMDFITGSTEKRRWFFDQNICLYDPFYLDTLQRYKKILKSRNAILKEIKEGKNSSVLDAIDPQLVEYGLYIMEKRNREIKFFSDVFNLIYEDVGNISGIKIDYRPSWKSKDIADIMTDLSKNRSKEILFGSTLTGPHRDKYIFVKDAAEFDSIASTGQKRLLALILRVAQVMRYFEVTKKEPILLFDDVLLELDGEKRKRFLQILPAYKQAFYTFLPEEHFEEYKRSDTIVYNVYQGKLTYEKNR